MIARFDHSATREVFTHRLTRIGLTGALVASSVLSVLAPHTFAQSDALLSTSTVVPANTALYVETKVDPESDQYQQLDALLTKLGSEESLLDSISSVSGDQADGFDLVGAEVAVAILPSALASAEEAGSILGEISDINAISDAQEIASDTSIAVDDGYLLVVRPTNIDDVAQQLQDEAGIDAPTESYLGVDIVEDRQEGGASTFYAIIDTFLVGGQSVSDVKQAIDASTDGGSSLAGVDAFQTGSSLLPSERVAYGFANGSAILDALDQELGDPTLAGIVRDALSVYSGYTAVTIGADEAGVRLEMVNIPAEVVPAVTSVPTDLTMADRMPIDTVLFVDGFELGQSTIMRSVGLLFVAALGSISSDSMEGDSVATPEPMSVDEMYDSLAQLLGFNISTDFIQQMTGEYGFGLWGIENADPSEIGAALVSGVDDVDILGDTVGSISFLIQAAGQGEINVTSRALETGPINNVTFETDGVPISIDFGVVGDEFILGVGNGADMVINGPTESLSDSTTYMTALSYLPAEYTSVFYVDVAALSDASSGMGDMMSGNDMMEMAVDSPVESIAAVGWTEDGYGRTSAIVVVP